MFTIHAEDPSLPVCHCWLGCPQKGLLHPEMFWMSCVCFSVRSSGLDLCRSLCDLQFSLTAWVSAGIQRLAQAAQGISALNFCLGYGMRIDKQLLGSFLLASKRVACYIPVLCAVFSPPKAELETAFSLSVCTSEKNIIALFLEET